MTVSPDLPAQEKKRLKKRWFAYFGANTLALSILLHVVFGVAATYLIVEHFVPKHINFHATEPPSVHTDVEHKVQMAKRNNVESAPPDIKRIVSTEISPITLPDPPEVPVTDEANPSPMSGVDGVMGSSLAGSGDHGANGSPGGNPLFGAPDGSGLQGDFYDLKQTPDKQPTNLDESAYYALLKKYLAQGWDDSVLNQYYKSKVPLYADSIAISTRPSEEAPKAFNLQNEVQPGLWVVHYHGTVSAPAPGEYRFAGFGDNVLVVRVRGQLVFDGGWNPLSENNDLHEALPFAFPSYVPFANTGIGDAHLKVGPTFRLAADPVDMDVLIGDDGGVCSFFLLIQKMDGNYEKTDDGTLKLPFFQLSSKDAPDFSNNAEHPPFSTTPEPWQLVEP